MNFKKFLLKTPSAWIPLSMSLAAIVLIISTLLVNGITQEEDEGTAAHLFQLLMGGQLPIIFFFAFKWLKQKPKETIAVLILQFIAGCAAFFPVFLLGL